MILRVEAGIELFEMQPPIIFTMKKRKWWLLFLLPVVGLFLAARQASSWRPQMVGVEKNAHTLRVSPDGRWLIVSTTNVTPVLWDAVDRRRVRVLPNEMIAISGDGKSLALVKWDPKRRFHDGVWGDLFETASGRKHRLLQEPAIKGTYIARTDWPQALSFSPDGREFWVASSRFLRRFDVNSGRLLRKTAWRGLGGDRKRLWRLRSPLMVRASGFGMGTSAPCATCKLAKCWVRANTAAVTASFPSMVS